MQNVIVENTRTSRINAVDPIIFVPALKDKRGIVTPSRNALTPEQYDKCRADKGTEKLFTAGILRVVEAPVLVAAAPPAAPQAAQPQQVAPEGNQGNRNQNQQRR